MKRIMYVLLVMTILITGCVNNKKDNSLEKNTKIENKFEENEKNNKDVVEKSSGQIAFGYLDADKEIYEYNGNDVKIPFYLENQGEKNEENANIGVMLFVDGNVQDYHIEENEEAKVMEKIVLKPKERKEFELIFKPVSGKKGEKVGVIPVTIWNPDSLPEEKNPIWGNNQQLGANIPLEIYMKKDGINKLQSTSKNVEVTDIPEDILEEYKETYVNDVYDSLDASVNFIMESGVKDKQLLYAKRGKVPVKLKIYGGKNVNEKITVFVNNNPVKIDGKDYIKVNTQKGKMITIKTNLDLKGYDRLNSIYAIVMTSGKDYKKQDVYKTDSLLLINE